MSESGHKYCFYWAEDGLYELSQRKSKQWKTQKVFDKKEFSQQDGLFKRTWKEEEFPLVVADGKKKVFKSQNK